MKTQLLALSFLLGTFLRISSAVVSYSGGTYSDNLDGLGTSSTWSNDTTLPGWYAYESVSSTTQLPNRADDSLGLIRDFRRSIGQTELGLLNLGTSNSSPNRSLGSINDTQDFVFALVVRNDSATTFTKFTLSYFGEQWQVNATQSNSSPSMKLDFSYGIFSSFNAAANNPNTIIPFSASNPDQASRFYDGYTNPAGDALDFSAFRFGNETLPLNGNDPANRTLISSTQSAAWAPGQFLVLRWFDDYSGGQQAMLAVNDVQFSANVPEPTTAVSLLLGIGVLASRRKATLMRCDSLCKNSITNFKTQ